MTTNTELMALEAELEAAEGCFDAAVSEGLMDRLAKAENTEVGSLHDLIVRRLLPAVWHIQSARAALIVAKRHATSAGVQPNLSCKFVQKRLAAQWAGSVAGCRLGRSAGSGSALRLARRSTDRTYQWAYADAELTRQVIVSPARIGTKVASLKGNSCGTVQGSRCKVNRVALRGRP